MSGPAGSPVIATWSASTAPDGFRRGALALLSRRGGGGWVASRIVPPAPRASSRRAARYGDDGLVPGQDLRQVGRVVAGRLGQAAQRHAAHAHQPPDLAGEVRHSRAPIPPGVDLWTALRVTTRQHFQATPGEG